MRLGPYELLREIGRGGAGAVYEARDAAGRALAVKLLLRGTTDALARFDRERRLQSALGEADGFVPLVDAGVDGGRPWIAMPFLGGGTLRDRLKHGALEIDEVIDLGRALAGALANAHARGVVHRDLKPENVLFDDADRPLVADLGLAKHFATEATPHSLSLSQQFRGTPGYLAPEQARDARSAGPPADVFSLGAILYEALTGERAFVADTIVELLEKLDRGSVTPVERHRPDAPRWLARAVERCLAAKPEARFADGAALLAALSEEPSRSFEGRIFKFLAVGALLASAPFIYFAIGPRAVTTGPRPVAPPKTPGVVTPPPLPPDAWTVETATAANPRADEAARRDAEYRRGYPIDASRLSEQARAHLDVGVRFNRAKKLADAIAAFTRVIELHPDFSPAWGNRAGAKVESGDSAGAVVDATMAIALGSAGTSHVWHNRGLARAKLGDATGAIADLTRAIELAPDICTLLEDRCALSVRVRDLESAIVDAERSLALDERRPNAWVNLGNVHREQGKLDLALREVRRAVEVAPRAVGGHVALVAIHLARNEVKEALAAGQVAVEVAPEDASAWEALANARATAGDARALEDYARALERDPNRRTVYENRAAVREQRNDIEGALADVTRALELWPSSPRALLTLAVLRGRMRQDDEAIAAATRSIELEPSNGRTYVVRGNALARKGRHQEALTDFDRGVQLDPSLPEGWVNRGNCKERLGDVVGAIEDFQRGYDVAPNDPRAGRLRDRIERLKKGLRESLK